MPNDDTSPATGDGAAPSSTAPARDGWVALAVLALLAAVCCAPLMSPGWFTSHEQIRPLGRALAAYHEVAGGDPYPRWLSTGYLGKGIPLFNFYPPAFSLLVAYAHAAGVPLVLAAKLVLFLLFLAGSLGVSLWVRPHLGALAALLAGVLYLFAPYHFVDLYVRGATAEFTALAALPFLFLAVDLLVERLSARGLALLAFASAAIVLSHFLGALMIAPFAAIYALVRVVRRRGGWRAIARLAGGAALGACISAFYWLPALVERDALSAERARTQLTGYYSPFLHFVEPVQWLDPSWGFGGSSPGSDDGMSFQLGLVVVAAVVASALLARALARPGRGFVLLALGLGLAALWLTSAASSPLYERVETLRLVQFPWRFLGPATLFLAAAGAGFVRVLADRGRAVAAGAVAASAALAIFLSGPQRAVEQPLPVDGDEAVAAALAADPWSARFGNGDEYLPKDASVEVANAQPGGPVPSGLGVDIAAVRAAGTDLTFDVTSPAGEGIAVVPWHAFPGWEVSLDGRRWPLVPGPYGLIAFQVPQGRHVARVRFGTTPPRLAGWLLAALGVTALGIIALRERALSAPRPER